MNKNELIANVKLYIESLHLFDYIAYSWIILVFLLFIMLAVILRNRVGISIFFIILSFFTLFVSPLFVKKLMDGYIRKGVVEVEDITMFNYAKTLVATGKIKNEGKKTFSKCTIEFSIIKIDDNVILQLKNSLKPIRKSTIDIDGPIAIGSSKPFKVSIRNFTTTMEYNSTIKARCY